LHEVIEIMKHPHINRVIVMDAKQQVIAILIRTNLVRVLLQNIF